MEGKTVVLGVTGGFSAYKVTSLVSTLIQNGSIVKVIMTKAATRFVSPLTLQSLTRQQVTMDVLDDAEKKGVSHISLAREADLVIIAPATANTIGRLAAGLADDMLTATVVATTSPVLVVPGMADSMYFNQTVQSNLNLLKQRGFHVMDKGNGNLSCGDIGVGDEIVRAAKLLLKPKVELSNWKMVVTAGSTLEPLDPVTFLANHSTGRMGFALAEVAAAGGAEVILVTGPSQLPTPIGVKKRVEVVTAQDMYLAVKEHFASADALVMAAAVTDFKPKPSVEKLKKRDDILVLELETTIDILESIGKEKKAGQITVGFAAESTDLVANAKEKLLSKRLDFIVANDITRSDAGFAVDTNEVTILWPDGQQEHLPLAPKTDIAASIWERVVMCRQNLLAETEK